MPIDHHLKNGPFENFGGFVGFEHSLEDSFPVAEDLLGTLIVDPMPAARAHPVLAFHPKVLRQNWDYSFAADPASSAVDSRHPRRKTILSEVSILACP